MILTCSFHNFNLAVVKWNLAPVCFNYVTDRLWKVESISFVIILFIVYSGSLSLCNDSLRDSFQGYTIVENMRSAFCSEQSLDLASVRQMAIDKAWSGIGSDISVNSAHELGDRTLSQNRHCTG